MLTESQQNDLIIETNNFRLKAMALYNIDIPMINVLWDLRGKCTGKAYYSKHLIRYNPVLAAQNWDSFSQTIGHEVAHLVSGMVYGEEGKGHGPKWQDVMAKLELEVKRYHNYDVTDVRINTKRFVYFCPSCDAEHRIGKRRHDKHVARPRYQCNTCRVNIVLDYIIPTKGKSLSKSVAAMADLLKHL